MIIGLLVVILLQMPVAASLNILLVIIAALIVMAWSRRIRCDCRVRLVTAAEEAHIVDHGAPAILLAQKRQELEHQLIVCHVPLSENTLDLLEVPLGQLQCLNVLRRPPHMLILTVRTIYAKSASVVIALASDRPARVIALSCDVALTTQHVAVAPVLLLLQLLS